jgi:hypothetical protein
MLLRRCHYCGTGSGLPADDGHFKLPPDKRFKIRVLIPCYKVRFVRAKGRLKSGAQSARGLHACGTI